MNVKTTTKFVLSFALSLCTFSATFGVEIGRAITLNNEGVAALNNGKYDLAVSKLTEAVTLNPEYVLAKENLSIAYNARGMEHYRLLQYEAARKDFDNSLRLNNSKSKSLFCFTEVEAI